MSMIHKSAVLAIFGLAVLIVGSASMAMADCPGTWGGSIGTPGINGVSPSVRALITFDDGSGSALYVGGLFETAGGISANSIAKWNGSAWSTLGSGMPGGGIGAFAVFDDGSGPALYAAGGFTTAGGVSANSIAKWDGASWSPLGSGVSGIFGGSIQSLVVFDDGSGPALYAAGAFNTAGGVSAKNVAKWDGSGWSPLGAGLNNTVWALTVYDDGTGQALYAAGDFNHVTVPGLKRVAKWNGTSWSPVGNGIGTTSGEARSLGVFDDGSGSAMYVGGNFGSAGGVSAVGMAKWDGSSWSSVGSGLSSAWIYFSVYSMAVFDDGGGSALYVGGSFDHVDGVSANRVAKWNGVDWSALGNGMPYPGDPGNEISPDYVAVVAASTVGGLSALYAGGGFGSHGGVSANNIAKWNSTGECPPSDAGINRSRFISFVPGHSGEQMAIRVKLVSLHHVSPPYAGGPSVPFSSFEGEYRWVGPPVQYVESTSTSIPFYASTLQCAPHYQEWSTTGYLHVTGSAVVPSSQYEVQFASCMGNEDTCAEISAPLLRETTRWGDVETPYNPPALSIQPDLADVSALVNKFRSAPGAPIKARALLVGSDLSGNIDLTTDLSFIHISACVDAFRGAPYPHTGPEACP